MNEHGYFTAKPENLLQRIKGAFPDVPCQTYVYIDEGWDHQVLIVDNALVFRFPADEEYLQLLKNEIAIMARLKSHSRINIPDYRFVVPDVSFAGYPLVPGINLSKDTFNALSREDQASIAQQLGQFLTMLHTLIVRGYDFSDVPESTLQADQDELKQATEAHLKQLLSAEDQHIVDRIISDVDDMLAHPVPFVFIHGDIYSRHLLWDASSSKLGLIDFSDMNRSDPAVDFAELHEYGDEFVRAVYDNYRGPKDDTFLQRAWIYQQWVAVFMMTDHFLSHKTSFEEARQTFDWVKTRLLPTR